MESTEAALRQIEIDHISASEAKMALTSLQAVTAQRDTLCRELARLKEEMNVLSNAKRQSDLLLVAAKHDLDELRKRDVIVSRENLKVLQSAKSSAANFQEENSNLKSRNLKLEQEVRNYSDDILTLKKENFKLLEDLSAVQGNFMSNLRISSICY